MWLGLGFMWLQRSKDWPLKNPFVRTSTKTLTLALSSDWLELGPSYFT